ncbi:MAG: amino acid permease [Bacteroidetes bacterium]|nr:MAG: amino acid permease [Bacteroidota bacterium]
MSTNNQYTRRVAVNMVIANMIGTGIFTSLGYQVIEGGIPDAFSIVTIWLLGGLISLCGATVYGEVATRINRSGGEYRFLTEIYHPLLGFISGWISILVGFAAAIASLSLAASEYFSPVLGNEGERFYLFGLELETTKWLATSMIIVVVFIQLAGVKRSGIFQNVMTYFKIALIGLFLLLPFVFSGQYEPSGVSLLPSDKSMDTIFSSAFAGSLVWVMFAYSGWNASAYIVGNLKDPHKNLPYSLIKGTIIVTLIYLALNIVFMYVATFDELAFQVDLGNVVATKILGNRIALLFSVVFSLALISGINAMFIAGPRVIQEMGKDHTIFKRLGHQNENGAPSYAILTMGFISVVFVHTLSFSDLIEYIGVTLSVFSLLTVMGLFVLRYRDKGLISDHVVKAKLYPITPILFSLFIIWMIVYFLMSKSEVILWLFISVIPAVIIYYLSRFKSDTNNP